MQAIMLMTFLGLGAAMLGFALAKLHAAQQPRLSRRPVPVRIDEERRPRR